MTRLSDNIIATTSCIVSISVSASCICIIITKVILVYACVRVCVCAYEREMTRNHSTQAKLYLSRHPWTWGVIIDSPLTQLGMAPAATKVSCFKKNGGAELD